jgi:hypothetical protein
MRILCGLLIVAGCSGAAASPAHGPEVTTRSARVECVAIMSRTRACADIFVPALMRLRVRLDRPPGIAARYEAEGEDALMPVARAQFDRDWSDEAIADNCDDMEDRTEAEREAILAPERACFAMPDCEQFVACDLERKERDWTAHAPPE